MSPLADYPADILFLQEVTPQFEADFPHLFPQYELAISHPRTDTQGAAMLVHNELKTETDLYTIHHLPWNNQRPLITTRFNLNGQRIQLMSLHTSRPHHQYADAFQQLEIESAAAWSAEQQAYGYALIMIGDLNLTPWSARFKHFLKASQTEDSMVGFGIQNSWSAIDSRRLGLPIDHAVVSDELMVLARQVIPIDRSDHGALFVRISTR